MAMKRQWAWAVGRLGVALSGALFAANAWATGDEQTCSARDGCFQFNVHGFYLINFLVFVGVLVYYGRKPLREALDSRYNAVAKDIEAAQAAKQAAEAKLLQYQAKIAELATENERLLAEVRAGTDVEVGSILADARAQVERITAEEALRLSQESKKLLDQLQREAARLALQVAEQVVRQRLNKATQDGLVLAALAELEGAAAPTPPDAPSSGDESPAAPAKPKRKAGGKGAA